MLTRWILGAGAAWALSFLLNAQNDLHLRTYGLAILVHGLNAICCHAGLISLYANTVPLSIFEAEYRLAFDLMLSQHPERSAERFRILELLKCPSQVRAACLGPLVLCGCLTACQGGEVVIPSFLPLFANDSTNMLRFMLHNIVRAAYIAAGSTPPPENPDTKTKYEHEIVLGLGIDRAKEITTFMVTLLRDFYLLKLTQARVQTWDGRGRWRRGDTGSQSAEQMGLGEDVLVGCEPCPPSVLFMMIAFLVEHCVDMPNAHSRSLGGSALPSPACPILKTVLLGQPRTWL